MPPIKNSRMGKRGPNSSSSSSFSPTITMMVFVTVSILAVWYFTSSIVPPNAVSSARNSVRFPDRLTTRLSLTDYKDTDPPPALDDTQGDLPEDAVKDDENLPAEKEVSKEQEHHNNNIKSEETEEIRSEEQQQKIQDHSEEQQQDNDVTNEQQAVQNNDQSSEEQQQNADVINEQEDKGNSEEQQQKVNISDEQEQSNEQNPQEEQQQNADVANEQEEEQTQNVNISDEQQQQQEQSNERSSEEEQKQQPENTDVTEEPKMETNGGEEITNDDPQEFHPDIDEKVQRRIEEGEGGGITSQSQVMHDTEGTTEEEQQQSQESNESGQQRSEDNPNGSDSFPDTSRAEVSGEKGKTWRTQADQSVNENERRKEEQPLSDGDGGESGGEISNGAKWELCNVTAGPDYIPCLDNEMAIKKLHSLRHFEHRERHCPEESPTCLVSLPEGYKQPIEWPQSRDRIWYSNVPRTKLAEVKGHQNWVKITGEYLTFPGGGTQFIHGALHYIDFIEKSARPVSWGKHTRVILDVGCGVASFGGYLFEKDVLALSFAPKDEHEAQVQFALERGIPAISAVMGSQRLPFPSRVFDIVHCARCRVPWHADGGALLLELNRILRPGGFFVWSATPVYQKLEEDVQIWNAMTSLTKSMCWDLSTIQKDKLNGVGAAFYRKPISNDCYKNRKDQSPPLCKEDDNPNAAWYVPLQACIHPVPTAHTVRGSRWPEEWPQRLVMPPYWLNRSQLGVYGKPEPDDFKTDYEHWQKVVTKSYLTGFGIEWSNVRNVMDMRAVYGGFAAALRDLKVWVMNVVNIDSPDTLPLIYERGLFGIYHDWCESFSTYPRTYDLLHADHLFSQLMTRCTILPVVVEIDRIVRPGGKLIIRDESAVVTEVENLLKSLHWEIRLKFSKNQEGMLCAEKSDWRPE